MQKKFKKTIEFLLLAFSIMVLTVGILKFAFPKFFGEPSYLYTVVAAVAVSRIAFRLFSHHIGRQ
jgi:uncharacterized membrane-anchored protein YitT (DUF2179 family)